jgi:hypothetical protein
LCGMFRLLDTGGFAWVDDPSSWAAASSHKHPGGVGGLNLRSAWWPCGMPDFSTAGLFVLVASAGAGGRRCVCRRARAALGGWGFRCLS